jgi:hypothetical protein
MSLFTTQGYRYQLVAGDNVILDTFADESIKVSNNITELFDIGAVPGTFTRTITLPGTKKNNAFFEEYYDISVYDPDTFNANQKVAAYLDFGSIYLVNGYLQLTKVNIYENKFVDSYEVNIFGAISNFSVETNRLYLDELDNLSVYNHTSSYDAITGSWAGQLFNGDIVYPMADYGKRLQFSNQDFIGIDDNEDALTVADYKPAMRLKAIWNGIFQKVGFTYTGSFFNEPFLEDTYVILNRKGKYPIYDYANLETLGTGKVTTISGSADNYALTNSTITNFPLNSIVYDSNNSFTVGNPIRYTAPISSSRYSANIQLSYSVTNNGANTQSQYPVWYLYYFDDNGNQLNAQVLTIINDFSERTALGRTSTQTENFTWAQPLNIPQINSGSVNFKIEYVAYTTAGGGGIAAAPNFTVALNPSSGRDYCSLEITQARQGADNRILNVPQNMPFGINGIKLIEFIRAVQKKFNLVIYEDKSTPNQMIVETFNDWYKKGEVQDFNQYINLNEKLEFIPANSLAVNKVNFTDKLDADYVSKVFQQTNNRTYGQAFFLDTGSYFSQGEFKVETSFGSGPIFQLPLTVASGSAVTSNSCTTYKIQNNDDQVYSVDYTDCDTAQQFIIGITGFETTFVCSRIIPIPVDEFSNLSITSQGDCSPAPPTASLSSSFLPIAIPLYIGDQNYAPTQVFPRVMFNNGMISSSRYWIEGQFNNTNKTVVANPQTVYPYFDNYNVVTGVYPSTGSRSLLFNNETTTLGSIPEKSLINEYWETYLNLLYNPRTRLVNAQAVIPLAKYFDMELNDLVQFRGNYYHLRAINDYDLTTGECLIQLLGPVIGDAVSAQLFGTSGSIPIPPVTNGDFNCDFNNDFFNNGCINPLPVTTASIDYLIVGGGGGGGQQGAGGGAGAFISGSTTLITGSYTIIVGSGGPGAPTGSTANNGTTSSFNSLIAEGGGAGGSAGAVGSNGGSGGGGSYLANGGTGSLYGKNGGNGAGSPFGAGGGGGASTAGSNAVLGGDSGNGGNGLAWLDGRTYAGGGGGGFTSQGANAGSGGTGGGGFGQIGTFALAVAGTNASGSGGGGGGNSGLDYFGAKGGDGVVKIRYAGSAIMSGGTITSDGGYTYHTFTNTTGSNTLSFP